MAIDRATRRERRARTLEPVSRRGKAAQITTGACILGAALLTVWSAWGELTCPYGGPAGREWCRTTVGVGGVFTIAGIGAAILGAIVLVRGVWRPVDREGGEGWAWGEAILIATTGLILGFVVIDAQVCPPGYDMATGFDLCIRRGDAAVRVDSTSQIGPRVAAVVGGVALAVVVGAWRRIPWPVATAVTVGATAAGAAWLIEDTVGLPW